MKKVTILLFSILLICVPAVFAEGQQESCADDQLIIGVSMSTLANPFFVTMKDAGVAEAEKQNIKLIVLDAQDDVAKQSNQVQDLIIKEVDGIILNPVDSDAVGSVTKEANRAGIPVITITRPSNAGEILQHIDSDNKFGGNLAGDALAEAINEKGQVVELEGIPGAPSTLDRGSGFNEAIAKYSDIEVVAAQTANYSRQEGLAVMENLLQAFPGLVAVFAHNDEMALGAVAALKSINRNDVVVVGFDATDDALVAIEKGEMTATVAQQPKLQMELAIQNMIKHLNGEDFGDEVILAPLKLIK